MIITTEVRDAVQQLYPALSLVECQAWLNWAETQPDYYVARVDKAVCVSKVYQQPDPPWKYVAQEVAWWGHGRDAVRALHRGMDWARLRGATLYGYSIAPDYNIVKWRSLP